MILMSFMRYFVCLKGHCLMTAIEPSLTQAGQGELAEMLSTLCSYENFFGAFHPQTLMLTTAIARAYRKGGEAHQARRLLEKVIADSARCPGPGHPARMAAIAELRDLLVGQGDFARAAAAQRELLEYAARR